MKLKTIIVTDSFRSITSLITGTAVNNQAFVILIQNTLPISGCSLIVYERGGYKSWAFHTVDQD